MDLVLGGVAATELLWGGTGGSEVRTSRMAERARFGEDRGGLSEEGCSVPVGGGLLFSLV